MTKILGSETGIAQQIGLVTQGLGFTLLPVEGDIVTAGEVMIAESNADQDPVGLDTPLQIEFGPAQNTDIIDLAADGTLTVKETGAYLVFTTFYFSRASSVGEVHFYIRLLKDGIQQGNPIAVRQSDDDITLPLFLATSTSVDTAVPTDFTLECVRDSSGVNSGGLRSLASGIGWGQTPSARMRIIKI